VNGSLEYAAVSTSLLIRKWDAEQTEFVLRKAADQAALRRLKAGSNVTVHPRMFEQYGVEPFEVWQRDNVNNVLQAGWVALLGGIAGTSITNKFSATNGRIGVGTSSTAVSYTQTALQGDTGGASTTSYYKLVSGAPTISTGSSPPTLVFTSAFGTGVANFAWNEFGTDNYTTDGVTTTGLGASYIFFNRGVVTMGTKASGQTWTATETISFGYPSGSGTVS
jgi:hypothetical protein